MKLLYAIIILLTMTFNSFSLSIETYFIETETYPRIKRMIVYAKYGNIWKVHIGQESYSIYIDITCYTLYDREGRKIRKAFQ